MQQNSLSDCRIANGVVATFCLNSKPTNTHYNYIDIKSLIIQLVIGAIGGNGIGAVLKNLSLGPIGNTVAGLLGGAGGVQLLGMISPELAQGLGGQIGGAAAGGGVLMAITGVIKSILAKK